MLQLRPAKATAHPCPNCPLQCPNPQRRGIKLNPITTLYLIAPCCFVFLCVPFVSACSACGLLPLGHAHALAAGGAERWL